VFECLSQARGGPAISEKTPQEFQNNFFAALAGVPIISLLTFGSNHMQLLPSMAEHVSRGLPLVLIDSRKRKTYPTEVEDVKAELKEKSEELHQEGCADWYNTSILAFVRGAVDRARAELESTNSASEETVQSSLWIFEAIERQRALPSSRRGRRSVGEDSAGVLRSGDDQLLRMMTDVVMKHFGGELEWEMSQRHEAFHEAIQQMSKANTWNDFQSAVEEGWLKIRGCCFHFFTGLEKFIEANAWAEMIEHSEKHWMNGQRQLTINVKNVTDPSNQAYLEKSKESLIALFQREFEDSSGRDKKNLTVEAFVRKEETWLAVYDILTAENLFY